MYKKMYENIFFIVFIFCIVCILSAGRWTRTEHEMFIKGLALHSKQWKLIAELIKTRTIVQVRFMNIID